jgi:hypothetical protein
MSGQNNLSVLDKMHIQELFMDETLVSSLVKRDHAGKLDEIAKNIRIGDDGMIEISFGNWHWLSKLLNDIKRISFSDFAFSVALNISGQSNNKNEIMFNGLSKEIIGGAILKQNYSYVVDCLFDAARYGYDGVNRSKYIEINKSPKQNSSRNINNDEMLGDILLNSGEKAGRLYLRRS